MADLTRLQSILLTSQLQNSNNPLYQVINQLIGVIQTLQAQVNGISSDSGDITNITNVTNNYVQQFLSGDSDSGSDGEMGPPGIPGRDGANGMVPYYIAPTEEFIIPEFKQALFAMNIDNEGILTVDGFLIEVG